MFLTIGWPKQKNERVCFMRVIYIDSGDLIPVIGTTIVWFGGSHYKLFNEPRAFRYNINRNTINRSDCWYGFEGYIKLRETYAKTKFTV